MKREEGLALGLACIALGGLIYYIERNKERPQNGGDGTPTHFICTKDENTGVLMCMEVEGEGEDECKTSWDCPCTSMEECGVGAGCFYGECIGNCNGYTLDWEGKATKRVYLYPPNRCALMQLQGEVHVARKWYHPNFYVLRIRLHHWDKYGNHYVEKVYDVEYKFGDSDEHKTIPIVISPGYQPVSMVEVESYNTWIGNGAITAVHFILI